MGNPLQRREFARPQQIPVDVLHPFAPEPAQIAALSYEGSHRIPFPEKLIHEMASDESCSPGYENTLTHLLSPRSKI
jgi:hypothetical protein